VALAALTCLLAATLVLVRLHLTRTGLSPVRDAVSNYGTSHEHRLYRALVVLLGLGALLVALRLDSETDATGLVWLYVFAATRIAIAGFMIDTAPRVHVVLASIAFTAIAVAGTTVEWSAMPEALRGVGVAIAVAAAGTLVTLLPPLRRVFGLAERALYATTLAWLLITAAGLL
jgi:hypothetical protein